MDRKRNRRRLDRNYSNHTIKRGNISRHSARKNSLFSLIRYTLKLVFPGDKKNSSPQNEKWFLKPLSFIYKNKGKLLTSAFFIFLIGIFFSDTLFRTVIIDPFLVNKEFQEKFYDDRNFANNLGNELTLVIQQAKSIKSAQRYDTPISEKLPNVEIPSIKISTKSIISYLRECFPISFIRGLFGYKTTRLSGEVTLIDDEIKISLRIAKNTDRSLNSYTKIFSRKAGELNLLMKEVSEFIMSDTEPYLFASYLYQTKRIEEARSQIQRICLQRDDDWDTFFALVLWGLILDDEKKYDQAIEKFNEALKYKKDGKIEPETVVAYNLWGQVLSRKGLLDEAVEKFETGIQQDPNYAPIYSSYAIALWKKGSKDKALANLEHALKLDRNLSEAYYNLGLIIHSDDPEKAYSLYLQSIELDPNFSPAYNQLGQVLQKISPSESEKALKYLTQSIDIDGNNAAAFNNRGNLLLKLKRNKEAVDDFKKSVEIYESEGNNRKNDEAFIAAYARAINNLGWAYELSGNYSEAEKAYRQSVAIKPDYFTAYIGIGDVCRRLGRFEEAKIAYDFILKESKLDERESAEEGLEKVLNKIKV